MGSLIAIGSWRQYEPRMSAATWRRTPDGTRARSGMGRVSRTRRLRAAVRAFVIEFCSFCRKRSGKRFSDFARGADNYKGGATVFKRWRRTFGRVQRRLQPVSINRYAEEALCFCARQRSHHSQQRGLQDLPDRTWSTAYPDLWVGRYRREVSIFSPRQRSSGLSERLNYCGCEHECLVRRRLSDGPGVTSGCARSRCIR
jgi:hypothetical protein